MTATSDYELAMLMGAIADRTDPLTRFVASLPPDMRRHAEETIRLRDEFVSHAQRMLLEEPARAPLHAEWITRHAHDVAFRWAALISSAKRWAALDVGSMARMTSIATPSNEADQ